MSNRLIRSIGCAPSIAMSPVSTASIKSWLPVRLSSSVRDASSALRIRRSEIASAPPNSLSNKRSTFSVLSGLALMAISASNKNGAMLAFVASASSSPATGIETCANARRTADVRDPGERTMTAICEYGTPSTRCARRN